MHKVLTQHAQSGADQRAPKHGRHGVRLPGGPRASRAVRAIALSLSCSLLVGACALPLGGDDEADADVVADATGDPSSTTAAVADDGESPADTEAASPAPAAAEDTVGRTGPIRDLAFFAPWSDTDLKPFLVEVMGFPEAVPIPANVVLTYVDASQALRIDQGQGQQSFSLDFQPQFTRDEFLSGFIQDMDPASWALAEQEEDLENNATRVTFNAVSPTAEHDRVTYTYTDGDTSKQPEVEMWVSGVWVDGRTDFLPNDVLWPWMNDVVVEEAMTNRTVSITLGWWEGAVSLDRRWYAPVGSFEASREFFQNNPSADLVVGETEYSDTVWPDYDIDVTRATDGFEGSFGVAETDPEDEVSVNLIGRYPLE